jgi:5-methyltetrahydrofolate--homocysteine methyltransferase
MARPPLLDAIAAAAPYPLLCDGAMGTQLLAAGLTLRESSAHWNLTHPDTVRDVHVQYRAAGCRLITTNTFMANRAALERHGLADQAAAINAAGVRLAREAAGNDGYVLGDIGPVAGFWGPPGSAPVDAVTGAFAEQARTLAASGADAILVETVSDPAEMESAIRAARAAAPQLPVLATYVFRAQGRGFQTLTGASVAEAIGCARAAGADVVGANCGAALDGQDYVRLADEVTRAAGAGTPTILRPNAGSLAATGDKARRPLSPTDLAAIVPALQRAGLRIIGGCCGTTPAHLAAMAQVLRLGERSSRRWPV